MIVTRFNELVVAVRGYLSNFYQGHFLLKEIRQGKTTRLARSIRHLNAKANPQVMAFGGIESQFEYRIKIQSTRTCLHVSPVTPNIENIHEGQTGEFFDVLLQGLYAFARRERGPRLFPCVAHQAQSVISDRLIL